MLRWDYQKDGGGIDTPADCGWVDQVVWTPVAGGMQTVTFETLWGSCETTTKFYAQSEDYGWLPEATRIGHDFEGWWTQESGGVRVTEESRVTEAAERTLYAHWKKAEPQTVWRFYSADTQGHFFTFSETEKDRLVAGDSWTFEGGAFRAFTHKTGGTVPLYRFYSENPGGHFFTIVEEEKERLIAGDGGWVYEGVAYYVYPEDNARNSVPVYRFWSEKHGHHFFTASDDEKEDLIFGSEDWGYEGIAFWALPLEEPGVWAEVTGLWVDAGGRTVTLLLSEESGRVKFTRDLASGVWEEYPETATDGWLEIPLGDEREMFFGNP